MSIQIEETKAYGQFVARAQMADGTTVEGWGLSAQSAEYRLWLKVQEVHGDR